MVPGPSPRSSRRSAGPGGASIVNGCSESQDGDLERPTFSPSLLCYSSVHLCQHEYWVCPTETGGECGDTSHWIGYRLPDGSAIAPKVHHPVPDGALKALVHSSPHRDPAWGSCHSFLRVGRWEFLGDSAHQLAGQTVEMVPLPAGWAS